MEWSGWTDLLVLIGLISLGSLIEEVIRHRRIRRTGVIHPLIFENKEEEDDDPSQW